MAKRNKYEILLDQHKVDVFPCLAEAKIIKNSISFEEIIIKRKEHAR